MSQDPNKKSLRQFQCRDYLWSTYEKMSTDLSCSVDYLINEAMRQYAKSRNYGGAGVQVGPLAPATSSAQPTGAGGAGPSVRPTMLSTQLGTHAPPPARPVLGGLAAAAAGGPVAGATTQPAWLGGAASAASGVGGGSSAARAMPPVTVPPPLPGSLHPPPSMLPAAGVLSVIFNGSKIPVNKGEFVIGRGSRSADLVIQDGNISRRHAAIVLQDGAYYIKDLGSTNGVEFRGNRVDSHRIQEGDVVKLCDHVLQFTFR
jgi:hypothetical protein